jgi:hypothetical protein
MTFTTLFIIYDFVYSTVEKGSDLGAYVLDFGVFF